MNRAMPNPNAKDLCVRATYQQLLGGSQAIVAYFKSPTFNVNRHNPPMMGCFDLRSNLRIVDFMSTSSKLFFAISGLSNCHWIDLVSTVPFYFNLRNH
jgi:hypothetical protein